MFEIITNLKSVGRKAKGCWLWSVEFRAVGDTDFELSHMSEGIAASRPVAGDQMLAAAEDGKKRLVEAGFTIKDTTW